MTVISIKNKRDGLGIKLLTIGSNEVVPASLSGSTNLDLQNVHVTSRISVNNQILEDNPFDSTSHIMSIPELVSPLPISEMNSAALKLQKVYKSYRTRRNLADCAVVVEELWWKALDFASLKHSSVSFYNGNRMETAVSRWARARTRAAKVGKGLSENGKARKLVLQHWLEAIDPRHRYGHNLHLYYDVWFKSESAQPFFYWLDVGDGKESNLAKCPRSSLQQQCIKYLGPMEREAYEVIINDGKLIYKQAKSAVHTADGAKWIFVLSTSRTLYVGQKKKGKFQHSSFLCGGAITAAGRLVVKHGFLKAIWSYSGHYQPTEENFEEFIKFLKESNVDLTNVKKYSVDNDGDLSSSKVKLEENSEEKDQILAASQELSDTEEDVQGPHEENNVSKLALIEFAEPVSRKWSSGLGPRIGCVREYPSDLQYKALEKVNLSPKVSSPTWTKDPIPSPRPCPKLRLSPQLAFMGAPAPKMTLTHPKLMRT
ncbi:hypothetical protein KSP39_PZI011131 [Platanthera zijinensis]|uniref:IQ domain-containing protein IQM1-like n=1 Tax=Platanthera zijinensis TaxID=2320716 RepID=A0AAP0BH82_9ASPA